MKAIIQKEVTIERTNRIGLTEWQNTKSRITTIRLFGIKIYSREELFVDLAQQN
ncbi:MAG: hypothetical protein J6V00_05405 [Bacteroidaceae bacterium]|nr:hypothetical protein [Bacteroidaceae bacterium]